MVLRGANQEFGRPYNRRNVLESIRLHALRGALGNAGEIIRILAVPDGESCSCGNRRSLERLADQAKTLPNSVSARRDRRAPRVVAGARSPRFGQMFDGRQRRRVPLDANWIAA
jgi:hypothetical protein